MMGFLRARQRAVTALFPHQGNKNFIIPKRFGLIPTDSIHKADSINNAFRSTDVSGSLVTTGFSILQDSTPVAVVSVDQIDGPKSIVVHHGVLGAGLSTTLHYDGTGDWIGANGRPVGPFTNTGII